MSSYVIAGRASRITDATGFATDFGYDSVGCTISTTVNNPGQSLTARTYFDKLGNVTDRMDAKGVVTRYEYDGQSRLTAMVENYRPGFLANADANVRTG